MATAGRLNTCGPKEVLGVDWAQGGGGGDKGGWRLPCPIFCDADVDDVGNTENQVDFIPAVHA